MKKTIILFIAAVIFKTVSAQNTNIGYKFSIKMYNLSRYQEFEKYRFSDPDTHTFQVDKTSDLNLIHPTIALQWRSKRNNFHEIEITDLQWEKTGLVNEIRNDSTGLNVMVYGMNKKETSLAARYEYSFVFNKRKESRFVPSVGFAISPYYKSYISSPVVSSYFPVSEKSIGLRTFVTPRFTYFIKERLFVDINIPVCISEAEFSKDRNDNPNIPSIERDVYSFDVKGFPKLYSARIGIGIKI